MVRCFPSVRGKGQGIFLKSGKGSKHLERRPIVKNVQTEALPAVEDFFRKGAKAISRSKTYLNR